MSDARHNTEPSTPPIVARIAAAGLLLLAVGAVAGCQSVKASSWPQDAQPPALERSVGAAEDATAADDATNVASEGDPSDEASSVPALVATPTFAPVPPHAPLPAFYRAMYIGRPVKFVPNDKHEVAITFDDGPSKNTTSIVSILAAHGAHATFFMVAARAEVDDDAVLSVVAAGDEVANHTWSHRALRNLDATMTAEQIDRAQTLLDAEAGTPPAFVRPRGGKYDEAGRMAVADRGLILALWSIHANDIDPSPKPEQIVKNVTRHIKPGSIVLMHETNGNTVLALPKILDELRAKGLHAVTLSQLLADGHL